jgi:hypothetical protein
MPRLLYVRGETTLYLLYGPNSLRGSLVEKPLPLPGIESIFMRCPALILVTIPVSPSPVTGFAERNENGNCFILGYYAANSCHCLPTFRDVSVSPKMEHVGWSETSVIDYYYAVRNKADERGSHLFRGGNLKSRKPKLK